MFVTRWNVRYQFLIQAIFNWTIAAYMSFKERSLNSISSPALSNILQSNQYVCLEFGMKYNVLRSPKAIKNAILYPIHESQQVNH